MTIDEVGRRMKVSRWTVQRWIYSGELDVERDGRNVLIPASSYRDFLARHTTTPTQRTA